MISISYLTKVTNSRTDAAAVLRGAEPALENQERDLRNLTEQFENYEQMFVIDGKELVDALQTHQACPPPPLTLTLPIFNSDCKRYAMRPERQVQLLQLVENRRDTNERLEAIRSENGISADQLDRLVVCAEGREWHIDETSDKLSEEACVAELAALLDATALPVNSVLFPMGKPLLHTAAEAGQASMCTYLVTNGAEASLSVRDLLGDTPLLAAVRSFRAEVVRALLTGLGQPELVSTFINITNNTRQTALTMGSMCVQGLGLSSQAEEENISPRELKERAVEIFKLCVSAGGRDLRNEREKGLHPLVQQKSTSHAHTTCAVRQGGTGSANDTSHGSSGTSSCPKPPGPVDLEPRSDARLKHPERHSMSQVFTDDELLVALDRLDAQWASMSAARIRSMLQTNGFVLSQKRAKALKAGRVGAAGPETEATTQKDGAHAFRGGRIQTERGIGHLPENRCENRSEFGDATWRRWS